MEDYIAGAAMPTAEASDLLPDYFAILRQSKYHRIVKSLKKAETKYKLEAISRHKEDEKKKAFQATRFKILNSKKEAALLSSKDMLLIASLLKDEKEYSTVRMQDKLRSFAMEKSTGPCGEKCRLMKILPNLQTLSEHSSKNGW